MHGEYSLKLNSLKCKEFIITFKKSPVSYESIVINNLPLERVTNANLLGQIFQMT